MRRDGGQWAGAPGAPVWTSRDQALLRTAQVMHAYLHGEFAMIRGMAVDFAVPGRHPENRIVASAGFRRAAYLPPGAVPGRRRLTLAEAPEWQHFDEGTVHVNQYGFYLRTLEGMLGWSWEDIIQARMIAPRRMGFLGDGVDGQIDFLIESELAELLFASWALARHPQHSQFTARIWLVPAWLQHYRTVFGDQAYPFDQALGPLH